MWAGPSMRTLMGVDELAESPQGDRSHRGKGHQRLSHWLRNWKEARSASNKPLIAAL